MDQQTAIILCYSFRMAQALEEYIRRISVRLQEFEDREEAVRYLLVQKDEQTLRRSLTVSDKPYNV